MVCVFSFGGWPYRPLYSTLAYLCWCVQLLRSTIRLNELEVRTLENVCAFTSSEVSAQSALRWTDGRGSHGISV